MTHPSAAQKRKRKREQKLLEEEARRVEEETAHHLPVSNPSPLPSSTAPAFEPLPARTPARDADPEPYDWYPPSDRPIFDAASLVFVDDQAALPILRAPEASFPHPKDWPADIRAFVYGSPTPSESKPLDWFDDAPDIPTVQVIHAAHSAPSPRDLSALCSESGHPWHTIRRRNRRLLPERRPFPRSLPKCLPARYAPLPTPATPIHALIPHRDPDEPLPVLVLPLAMSLPDDPYDLLPLQREPVPRLLPAATAYGTVQSGLALVCAQEYPWVHVALNNISEIAWGPHLDERREYLFDLQPDQLVFLTILAEMTSLEPDFALFFDSAIADFTNAWVDHFNAKSVMNANHRTCRVMADVDFGAWNKQAPTLSPDHHRISGADAAYAAQHAW
ncbi:hypothetical protein FB451DRAFT_1467254 [Mycena latifolia]|nr:hypothetical protein FB451DRAFT_1467254 [Mycena latifolia]